MYVCIYVVVLVDPIAFVVHINGLKAVIKDTESSLINSSNDVFDDDCDDDLTLFMDDTTGGY
jgi:hypothetical protein